MPISKFASPRDAANGKNRKATPPSRRCAHEGASLLLPHGVVRGTFYRNMCVYTYMYIYIYIYIHIQIVKNKQKHLLRPDARPPAHAAQIRWWWTSVVGAIQLVVAVDVQLPAMDVGGRVRGEDVRGERDTTHCCR